MGRVSFASCLLTILTLRGVKAASIPRQNTANGTLVLDPYSLPSDAADPMLRSEGIVVKQAGFLYGPPVAGGPYFPTGDLGLARVAVDGAEIQADLVPVRAAADSDTTESVASAADYNGLQTLHDYTLLYDDHWKATLPSGPLPGILTNYTQDLLFSMERLSLSPYQVKRLNPSSDELQFSINDSVAENITGSTLQELFSQGRLFYADYRDQSNLTKTERFAAACDAYFYIDTASGDFLPLAIRTNVGSNLIYTPNDQPDDWLLAKIMYNVNDFWFAQWDHFASTHMVVQIAYMAAIRTLSDDHPVLAVVNRLMYEVFAIQPLAASVLFNTGGAADELFPWTGTAAQAFTDKLYKSDGAGRFEANYFETDLESRGLIHSEFGPALKDFPFYEDASVIHDAISAFMTSFVDSYYAEDADVIGDGELQAWVAEAQGPAAAIDFPTLETKTALIDALTHMAHLASSAHHTVNTNELLSASSTLPFHTPSLYQAPPTSKGTLGGSQDSIAAFLPPLSQVEGQLNLLALFARQGFAGTNRTLAHMFDFDGAVLGRLTDEARAAAAAFYDGMQEFSVQVAARAFGADGLSQGMPFVWKALDPNVAPYSLTV
ncbi:lipoxygenase [Pestalotiopsis sp. NC0098]|nr:lipoxygenase [Pestalotiopsis sp. NC0098]